MMNQLVSWSERQDLNLPQPLEIIQGDSDRPARHPGKTTGKWPAILTVGLALAGCATAPGYTLGTHTFAAAAELRGSIDANGNDRARR